MAKIYKIEGYIVSPNGDEIDIEHTIKNYTNGCAFIRKNECEEFEWDDNVIVNQTDDYWEVDKFYCQLAYDRVVKELKEFKSNDDDWCSAYK